jgi:hypothetical protein
MVKHIEPAAHVALPGDLEQTRADDGPQRWRKGVLYDVGRTLDALGGDWRPDYSPQLMRRELDIIRTDLHCNAVRICGRDPGRVLGAAEYALGQGLEVWLSPERWNAPPRRTLDYLVEVATKAETLRRRWPDQLIFSVGNELTLFMRGIVPGRSYQKRARLPVLREIVRSGRHTPPLRAFLADAATAVRRVYHGPISYSALTIEDVDWELFDVVGVNHYRNKGNAHHYLHTLERFLATGKPVIITEFGFPACSDADDVAMLQIGLNARPLTFVIANLVARLPPMHRPVRPQVSTIHQRDEAKQARLLIDQLALLEHAGIGGAYIMSFSFPLATYDDDPRFDLDATALSLVRALPRNQRGTTYPDMAWEPKEAFRAVADYYATH